MIKGSGEVRVIQDIGDERVLLSYGAYRPEEWKVEIRRLDDNLTLIKNIPEINGHFV